MLLFCSAVLCCKQLNIDLIILTLMLSLVLSLMFSMIISYCCYEIHPEQNQKYPGEIQEHLQYVKEQIMKGEDLTCQNGKEH